MTKSPRSLHMGNKVYGWLAALSLLVIPSTGRAQAPRLQAEISTSAVTTLKGSLHPLARPEFDTGRMPAGAALHGMTLFFSRSAAQQADLEALLVAQQTPGSPSYHQWLTPDQFAARFGMAQSDIDKVESWLQQQGFSIDSVARSRNMIHFSGTAGQVEQAFQTQMHYYTIDGEKHFAPSTALSIPSTLSSVVLAIRDLDNFRPRPMLEKSRPRQANPAFTSSVSGSVFFAPGDIKVAYGVNALIGAGNDGTGQTIAVMGQSSIVASDIENFQSADGLTIKDPTQVLVPNTGTPQVYSGDEGESDLDLEWSGAMAPGAQIFFVYAGSTSSLGIYDSLTYAVDEKIGNIISISYGTCEPELSAGEGASLDAVLQQAASQGQTVVAAAGDNGSSACYVGLPTQQNGYPPLTSQEALSVTYPASSQYVTGVGGTEIVAADGVDPTTGAKGANYSTYWEGQSSSDVITSLLKYIPEVAWNDDLLAVNSGATSLSATGGGVSTLYTTSPTWQKGVPGIPTTPGRYVPDVSLYSSPNLPGYLFCTSDTSDWNTTTQPVQTGSCGAGFRGSSTDNSLTVAGGTSFATPVFAGMVAVLNQAKGEVGGQGLLNPTLYSLAGNGATYAAVFNDITTGNNECPSSLGSNYCSTASSGSYTTGTGYDPVTGLGSVNLGALASAWPMSTSTLIGTTTSVSAATNNPASGANDVITVTVTSNTGSTMPTGTVTLSVDGCGTSYGSSGCTPPTATLTSNGTATFSTVSFTTAGVHTVVAEYAGDTTHAASTGSVAVTVGGTSSGKGAIALAFSPSTLTVSRGTKGTENLTITPSNGYTGSLSFNYSTSNNNALSNLCVSLGTGANSSGIVAVASATTPVSVQVVVDTNAADCSNNNGYGYGYGGYGYGYSPKNGQHPLYRLRPTTSRNNPPGRNPAPLGIAFAGLVAAGFLGRRSRKLRGLASVIALLALGLGLSACGGGIGNGVSNPPKGTYTITFTGQDTTTSTISATGSFTLTID